MSINKSSSNLQKTISVLIPYKINEPFQYFASQKLDLSVGDFVLVPLGKKIVKGVVWRQSINKSVPVNRLKEVIEKLDIPPLKIDLLSLIEWVSEYTLSPLGSVLNLAMPPSGILEKKKKVYSNMITIPERLTSGRLKVFEYLDKNPNSTLSEISDNAIVSKGIIRDLIKKNYVKENVVYENLQIPEGQ